MNKNRSLSGKTVAVTGCTGGIGRELCFKLAVLKADIIMLDRNAEKQEALAKELTDHFDGIKITRIITELESIKSVKKATEQLLKIKPDIFIANAGAYSIPRHKCETGFENVFEINFVSPYYMIHKLNEALPDIKIVAVGSIAHTYSVLDQNDIDFATRKSSALIYGNSKRFLMLALGELFKNDKDRLAIVHPGITFTNITAHYPPIIFAIIKHPMKIIFMKPKKAADCLIEGIFTPTPKGFWVGPKIFGIWGGPKIQKLKAAHHRDSETAAKIAEEIYNNIK